MGRYRDRCGDPWKDQDALILFDIQYIPVIYRLFSPSGVRVEL